MSATGVDKECSIPMVVVFGRPGAGKSTVADEALRIARDRSLPFDRDIVNLDLDVCVPQWMRDNFAQGVYPTLVQRRDFAQSCCDYVRSGVISKDAVIISFSFVNSDLREIFRDEFPEAIWALVDVTDEVAAERIRLRKGHFYKGKPSTNGHDHREQESAENYADVDESKAEDNPEWEFAPVEFSHILLDGLEDAKINACLVADALESLLVGSH
eukprot:CAMPEP_0183292510 /NCGR_PEP_ID=MMETSP0160_2-20130417/1540_1 /TAXON_ID=2839 ORGANISM="Odontella Sinensis, Strain Grunow 1884" /NCGR_SAMPLE_ID=MMETSP0160_2 /ASSEMBLY_ACC=CAM_ASM_000250 /LENGTH=213 /DNA_ID=CAMNT_0025453469 /DNA_START=126 /DNA_END=767 /DNA_ORIENTATION=+